jgi:hypothetical protein
MFDFDECEEVAGHQLTLLRGMASGVSTYYCERCASLFQIGRSDLDLILFHAPVNSKTSIAMCKMLEGPKKLVAGTALKDKLKVLEDEDYERLRSRI